MDLFNMLGSMFQVPETRTLSAAVYYSPKEMVRGRATRGKLSKADIGSPSNFKHVTHVGFNSVAALDTRSNTDLGSLFCRAGIREEHLRDQELSRKIYDVIEKKGGMEAVRMEARRMTMVEQKSTPPYRTRSMSSSSMTLSKRPSSSQSTPHAAKIPANLPMSSPFTYLPSPSCVPSPVSTPPPYSEFPAMEPLPPPPVPFRPRKMPRPRAFPRKEPIPSSQEPIVKPLISPYPPSNQRSPLGTLAGLPVDCPVSDISQTTVPPPPPLPAFLKKPLEGKVSSLPLCSTTPLSTIANPPQISPFKMAAQSVVSKQQDIKPDGEVNPPKDPSLFLAQIKQGVHLKSVAPVAKVDSSQSFSIVSALMDVMQKRHKALHSSDEEDEAEDEWED